LCHQQRRIWSKLARYSYSLQLTLIPSTLTQSRVSRFFNESATSRVFAAGILVASSSRGESDPDREPRDNPAAKYLRAISPLMARDRGAIEGVIYFAYFVPRSIPRARFFLLPGDRSRELYAPAIMLMRITKITRRTRPCCTDRALDIFFEHFFISLSPSPPLCLLYAPFSTLRDVSS